jgi:hypothetical protein
MRPIAPRSLLPIASAGTGLGTEIRDRIGGLFTSGPSYASVQPKKKSDDKQINIEEFDVCQVAVDGVQNHHGHKLCQ